LPQVVPGIYLGNGIYVFTLPGSPSQSTDERVNNAAVGSLYLQTDGGSDSTLYVVEGTTANLVAK